MEPDSGTTNIRNASITHWKRWLGADNRCLAPFTSISEYDTIDGNKDRRRSGHVMSSNAMTLSSGISSTSSDGRPKIASGVTPVIDAHRAR
jgi:putative SOS response-associated peptidase YedK